MTGVVRLITEDSASVSLETIEALRTNVAPDEWSEFLEDVAFDLTRDLAALERAVVTRNVEAAEDAAHRLGVSGGSVGLLELAQAAHNLTDAIKQADPVAVGAVAARVLRLGAGSLVALVAVDTDPPALPS